MNNHNETHLGTEQMVTVLLKDSTRLTEAKVWIPEGMRLSDVMNDSRKFLPLKRLKNIDYVDTVIHKDHITRIEETL